MKKEFLPIIFLTLVNTLNFSILIPVLPFVVDEYGGGSFMYGILLSMYPLFQFFAAPILGALSDRYGRRPILLISQLGTLLSWFIFIASYFVPEITIGGIALPILVMMLARIADGATGGNNSVANAYIADISSPEQRTKMFGMAGGIVGVGLIIGPALGGISMGTSLGYLVPALIAAGISTITLIIMFFLLPESLDNEHKRKIVAFSLADELKFITKIKKYLPNRKIRYLFFIRSFFLLAFSSYSAIFVLFVIDEFNFNSSQVGLFFFIVGFFLIFNQTVVAQRLSRKIGDLKTFIVGQIALVISQLSFTFVPPLWIFIVFTYINNLGFSISFPTYRSILSNSVDKTKQGEIQGIDESLFAASSAISPLLATYMYEHIGSYTFGILALLILFAVIVFELRRGWKGSID